MLFNSYQFLFAFLPVTLIGFFALSRLNKNLGTASLVLASLFFYGWWNPKYVALLCASIVFNYTLGLALMRAPSAKSRNAWLAFGVASDLALLAFYKYAGFFADLVGLDLAFQIALPLGISFFTFTQIAFLVDVSRGVVVERNFLHYVLFVTYFPHLIAGPVLHHKEMMPQFAKPETHEPNAANFSAGLTLFVFGLFKKLCLADQVSVFASELFDKAAPSEMSLLAAWSGALAYTLQIYFDFSGYSDMAIGLARLCGITLPLNFNSPYKSINIIEFWRRWHMTLSRFLGDYLYFPLGGNRMGSVRRHVNLMTTMLLGGLWHGAGWTFVIWGGLHGSYLVCNHLFQMLRPARSQQAPAFALLGRISAQLLTFVAVVFAWVFFRARDLPHAVDVVTGMVGGQGVVLPVRWLYRLPALGALSELHITFDAAPWVDLTRLVVIAALLVIATALPNTQEIMARWKPSWAWLTVVLCAAGYSIAKIGGNVSQFLYYQF